MPVAVEPTTLRDGSDVLIRPIRASDKDRLDAAFEQLSERSRQMRFLGYKKRLTTDDLAYLTEVDHTDHEALVGTDVDTDEIVGVARYVRSVPGRKRAEAAVVVVDDWQRRGLGTALLDRLAKRARQEGICRFVGEVLAENHSMIDLFKRLGAARLTGAHGVMHVVVELD